VRSLLITGGTGGLGHEVVARLARDYRCIVLYRSADAWQRLQKDQPKVVGATDAAAVMEPLYGIVHLAGAFTMGSSPHEFETMLEANLMAMVRTTAAVAERIEDGGRIVAISSGATLTKPAGMAGYVASKSALNAYVEALAKELAPRRITVNALLPSALDTPAMRKVMARELLVPLDRVAETIAFLLSDAAGSISGQLMAMNP
jgi:NAD(P)-dependent dehydrogenase (short-subunit alcohol dehydrogenase family)